MRQASMQPSHKISFTNRTKYEWESNAVKELHAQSYSRRSNRTKGTDPESDDSPGIK